MGGPFWARKDARGWSIPKGEYPADEDPLAAAHREFAEEIGTPAPAADYHRLGDFRQPSGKIITVFTAEADFQPEQIVSNTFDAGVAEGIRHDQQLPRDRPRRMDRRARQPGPGWSRASCPSSTRWSGTSGWDRQRTRSPADGNGHDNK